MDSSPLTLSRPAVLEPKVVKLYEQIWTPADEDREVEKPEAFWHELFILRVEHSRLQSLLGDLAPRQLLSNQFQCHQFVTRSIECIDNPPSPASAEHALDRYTSPSSDIIAIVAGIVDVDVVFSNLVRVLEHTIRSSPVICLRLKAVRAVLAVASGANKTGLMTYFLHRDLFPSLMKLIGDIDNPRDAIDAIVLLGILASHSKFEIANPYHARLRDYVNDAAICRVVDSIGLVLGELWKEYSKIQDDVSEGWQLSNTLAFFGLGNLKSRSKTAIAADEQAKFQLAILPSCTASVLLATYEFLRANKIFRTSFVLQPATEQNGNPPFGNFLSLLSYLTHYASLSSRTSQYTQISLFILQLVLEDTDLVKYAVSSNSELSVRLCRQKAPLLPLVPGPRPLVAVILDVVVGGLNHNRGSPWDADLTVLCLGIIQRTLRSLAQTGATIDYHWPALWQSLFQWCRLLIKLPTTSSSLPGTTDVVYLLLGIIALALTEGELICPNEGYDDLIYKLVESDELFQKLRTSFYSSSTSTSSAAPLTPPPSLAPSSTVSSSISISIGIILSVYNHYKSLLDAQLPKKGGFMGNNSAAEVWRIIKNGYESLSIDELRTRSRNGGVGMRLQTFRESEHAKLLKAMGAVAVTDAVERVKGDVLVKGEGEEGGEGGRVNAGASNSATTSAAAVRPGVT